MSSASHIIKQAISATLAAIWIICVNTEVSAQAVIEKDPSLNSETVSESVPKPSRVDTAKNALEGTAGERSAAIYERSVLGSLQRVNRLAKPASLAKLSQQYASWIEQRHISAEDSFLHASRSKSAKKRSREAQRITRRIIELYARSTDIAQLQVQGKGRDAKKTHDYLKELAELSQRFPELAPLMLYITFGDLATGDFSAIKRSQNQSPEQESTSQYSLNIVTEPHLPILMLAYQRLGLSDTYVKLDKAHDRFADRFSRAELTLLRANAASLRGDCDLVLASVPGLIQDGALSKEKNFFAALQHAVCLQKVRKQREAIEIYKKLAKEPNYAELAVYNRGVAFVHQGWWSDTSEDLDALVNMAQFPNDGFYDFLNVQKGFNLLFHNMYRDARVAFRKVRLNSEHINTALLGLGLSAMHQRDYIGALNAFENLNSSARAHPKRSLEELESFLLIAFVQARLKQQTLALDSYQRAIAFYENEKQRILFAINELVDKPELLSELYDVDEKDRDTKPPKVLTKDSSIAILRGVLPPYTRDDINARYRLAVIMDLITGPPGTGVCKTSVACLTPAVLADITRAAQTRVDRLDSYIAQARFGIAQTYDNKQELPAIDQSKKTTKFKNRESGTGNRFEQGMIRKQAGDKK